MKSEALDYVSDYFIKSACKDAPSWVTEKIFAVLVD